MNLPNQAQLNAGLRYAGTVAGTAFTIAAAAGAIDQATAQAIVAQIHLVADDLKKTFGDGWQLVVLVGPVVTIWIAKIGYASASLKKQIAAVQASPKANVTVSDPKLAEGIPGVKVQP